MSCYYLIASLPSLTPDADPPLSPDAFKALCRTHLAARDAAAAERLCDGPDLERSEADRRHPFVSAWLDRETQLRNASARVRAARRKQDAAGAIRPHGGFDVSIEDGFERAFDQATPLARDEALDHLRWRLLDELAGVAPFSPSVVLAYAVRLRLARRRAALDTDHGLATVQSILKAPPSTGGASGTDHHNGRSAAADQPTGE